MLKVLDEIPSSDLDEAILVLPLSYVLRLIPELCAWLRSDRAVERVCRVLFFLLRSVQIAPILVCRCHHNQLVAARAAAPHIQALQACTRSRLQELKDMIGFNVAGLRAVQQEIAVAGQVV